MFERPKSGERAILVEVAVGERLSQDQIDEFEELALSAGATICASLTGNRQSPNPRFYIGSGKVEELGALVKEHDADLVLFNHELSPSQERNLEQQLRCRVLDRTGLILDIFAQRARSFEGKLQVELAQLRHLATRLVRGWTHLERQKGGIGLRGPGETQLETDRRLIGQRIKHLRSRLERVDRQRALLGSARRLVEPDGDGRRRARRHERRGRAGAAARQAQQARPVGLGEIVYIAAVGRRRAGRSNLLEQLPHQGHPTGSGQPAHEAHQAAAAAEFVDLLQVPAFLCRQTDLM